MSYPAQPSIEHSSSHCFYVADQVVDYFNALEPSLEVADQWDARDAGALQASVGLGEITLDAGVVEADVEIIEEEEEE